MPLESVAERAHVHEAKNPAEARRRRGWWPMSPRLCVTAGESPPADVTQRVDADAECPWLPICSPPLPSAIVQDDLALSPGIRAFQIGRFHRISERCGDPPSGGVARGENRAFKNGLRGIRVCTRGWTRAARRTVRSAHDFQQSSDEFRIMRTFDNNECRAHIHGFIEGRNRFHCASIGCCALPDDKRADRTHAKADGKPPNRPSPRPHC